MLLTATGAAVAFFFDCYRVTRNSLKLRKLTTEICDLIYWLLTTAIVFLALLKGNWGEIRFFVFLALISGAGLYFHFVSVYATAILGKTARVIGKVLRLIVAVTNFLFIRPVLLPMRWICRHMIAGGKEVYRRMTLPKDRKPPEE